MADGSLKLHVVDVYGDPVGEPVDIFMRHQTLSDDPSWRGVKPAKTITLKGLNQSPQGLYRIEIDAPSYLAVSQFTTIPSSGSGNLVITLPVNKDRVVSVTFPQFDELDPEARRLLSASNSVLSFGNLTGAGLYDAFDPIRRAGFLNLATKAAHTRLSTNKSVLSNLSAITEQRGDRVITLVAADLHGEVAGNASGLFHRADDSLHTPPPGFQRVDSYKTLDHFGNLQLTFSSNGTDWAVDMDIDDAQGFEHLFQVVHNAATGQPTHPYNIHEILVEFQELDPGYRFILTEPAKQKAPAA